MRCVKRLTTQWKRVPYVNCENSKMSFETRYPVPVARIPFGYSPSPAFLYKLIMCQNYNTDHKEI